MDLEHLHQGVLKEPLKTLLFDTKSATPGHLKLSSGPNLIRHRQASPNLGGSLSGAGQELGLAHMSHNLRAVEAEQQSSD